MSRLYMGAGVVATVLALVFWLRIDAVSDERARKALEAEKARNQTQSETRERDNEIRTYPDRILRDALSKRVFTTPE